MRAFLATVSLAILIALVAPSARDTRAASSGWPNTSSVGDSGFELGAGGLDAEMGLAFVTNAGQAPDWVDHYVQAPGLTAGFGDGSVMLTLRSLGNQALELSFPGADVTEPQARNPLPGRLNYFSGPDPAAWKTDLSTFGEVVYADLWPGIDLLFRGGGGQLKYELHVAPGADPSAARMAYRSVLGLSLDGEGNLLIDTAGGRVKDVAPVSYQEVGGQRRLVESAFRIEGDEYGFTVGAYDPSLPLIIDPGLVYSTYVGGGALDAGFGVAVDGDGNAYVTGATASLDFPATAAVYDATYNNGQDAFVIKLDPSGTPVYATYLGGSAEDQGVDIAVDGSGAVYVTGWTASTNFPTTAGAFDTSYNGGVSDVFLAKLSAAGDALVYSTFLGGTGQEQGIGIAAGASGVAYVTGMTRSSNFPTTAGAFSSSVIGNADAFLSVVNTAGSSLAYSTLLGGDKFDQGYGVAVDGSGAVYVGGGTQSLDFPTTAGAFEPIFNGGAADGFVTKLMPTAGSPLVYSTFIGSDGQDGVNKLVLDAGGNAYVTGYAGGANYPVTAGAVDTSYDGAFDAMVTKLSASGSSVEFSTYLGGDGRDMGEGIGVVGSGEIIVAGVTESATGLPVTPGALDESYNGGGDAFVMRLSADMTAVTYGTYLGGGGQDKGDSTVAGLSRGKVLAVGADGSAYVTGLTASADFPTSAGAFDSTYNGAKDAFVTKLGLIGAAYSLSLEPAEATNTVGTEHTVTASVRDYAGTPVPGADVVFSVGGANIGGGEASTDNGGEATFSYTGTVAGVDAIHAFADLDGDDIEDAGEPAGDAAKTWVPGDEDGPVTRDSVLNPNPAQIGAAINLSAIVDDGGHGDSAVASAEYQVDGGPFVAMSAVDGGFDEVSEEVIATLPGFAEPGVHLICVRGTDAVGNTGEPECVLLAVFDPSGGFVTGGGWINSPAGAYQVDPALTGKANFGFVSKYKKGANVPTGETEFQFKAGNLNFQSTSYEWLVVAGSKAQFKGHGTINGAGDFQFMLTARDGGNGGGVDSFRIKIWDASGIVYDNKHGESDTSDNLTELGGGNIVIHK